MTATATAPQKICAYYRVSTKRQNLGLDAQRNQVQQYATAKGFELVAEFSEKESGKDNDRKALNQALQYCKKNKCGLVVAKLDRLSRNASFLLNLFNDMKDGKIDLTALNMPPVNDILIYGTYAILAQKEREMNSERTKQALASAKANGVILGNPHLQETATPKGLEVRQENARRENKNAYLVAKQLLKEFNRPSHIAEKLNEMHITTRTGKAWTCQAVKNLFALYGDSVKAL